ncbi:MAG: hypothetical protein ACMXX6_00430 [Candidatus Woesearchaeota archaeon]
MNVEEDLKSVKIEDLKPPRKPKKLIIIIFTLFMVFLISSFVYITYPSFDIIKSKIESRPLQGDLLQTPSLNIYFGEGIYEEILEVYKRNQNVETALCFQGNIQGNNYFVENIYKPNIISQGPRHVTHEACSEEIVMFHTHPYQRCSASRQDIQTLENAKLSNPEVIMIIMCEENRFSVYS